MRPPETTKTLEQLGLSKQQSSRWQELAQNPKAVERYLKEEQDVPTTAGALAAVRPPPKPTPVPRVTDEVLWLWGRLRELRDRKIKKQAIRVANVPREDFERQVESEKPPTITALGQRGSLS